MGISLKSRVQNCLRQVGVYERLKSSSVYDLYWTIVDKKLIEARSAEIEFYRTTLNGFRPGNLVFDIGANQGHKTDIFLRLGAEVLAVDPDAINQGILERRFLKLRLSRKRVTIVKKAVSEAMSVATMWVDEPGSAKNTLNQKWVETLREDETRFGQRLAFGTRMEVETTTLEQLVAAHGTPFYIKIDVEGHEPNVLRGMERPVRYLSFEVNLPEFKAEGLQCVERLREIEPSGEFNYAADCAQGLVLKQWVSAVQFVPLFEKIQENSVEVFWRTAVSAEPETREL